MTRLQDISVLRLLIALTVTLSLALSPVAARPAHADQNGDLIAALIALGIFGAVVANGSQTQAGQGWNPRSHGQWTGNANGRKFLPGSCLREFKTRFGKETFFAKRCLRNNYRFWRRLPDACETDIRVRRKNGQRVRRTVYEPRCLVRKGYRIAFRR